MASIVLLDLLGGVALLLWGLHMVQSGVMRAFGPELRRVMSRTLRNRFVAFAGGLGLTALLQSSTATALMTASFVSDGVLGLVPALAIMLGANVGTTLIVQLLSFNVAAAAPVLFVIGLLAFRKGRQTRLKDLGRAAIGIGLVLLALHVLIDSLAPAENAPTAKMLFQAITGDPVLCILIAAVLTWIAHSSVATVLLIMSLAYANFVTPEAALALVLGANLGSAINPVLEGTRRDNPASYRLPVGNLLNRCLGVFLITPFLPQITGKLVALQPNLAMLVAQFHIGFNVVLALACLPFLDSLARVLERIFPARPQAADPSRPRYLDEGALDSPSLALADAARETLRLGDFVEVMLRDVMKALTTGDRRLVAEVSRMDDAVDRLEESIKLYVTRLTRIGLDDREGRRAMEIISFAINLEHVGDIIDKNLSELAAKRIKRNIGFSDEGAEELLAFHARILASLRLAFSVFMSGDAGDATRLIDEKVQVRNAELAAAERHFDRLREGRVQAIETTSLHFDILRDLKRIHSHISSVAYPVLEGAGQLPLAETSESDPITLTSAGIRPSTQ